ncbi:hypothetical protein LXL04_027707 [Taraxacum kok-saghyz]
MGWFNPGGFLSASHPIFLLPGLNFIGFFSGLKNLAGSLATVFFSIACLLLLFQLLPFFCFVSLLELIGHLFVLISSTRCFIQSSGFANQYTRTPPAPSPSFTCEFWRNPLLRFSTIDSCNIIVNRFKVQVLHSIFAVGPIDFLKVMVMKCGVDRRLQARNFYAGNTEEKRDQFPDCSWCVAHYLNQETKKEGKRGFRCVVYPNT